MTTLRGMAEHRFSIVYNEHFTLLWYFYYTKMTTAWPVHTNANLFFDKKKNTKLVNIWPS